MSYVSPFTGDVIQPTDVSFRAVTLSANTQLNWPSNSTTNTDFASRIMQVTATAGSLNLYMPPADQTSVGNDALIRNIGANTFTVKDYAGTNTIVSVAAGESKYIYITANPTAQGSWGVIAFGTGTSSADAATLAGYGLVASGATLNQSHPSAAITSGTTFAATDRAQTRVWSSGSGTATLPAAATLGNNWFTLFKNNGTGSFIISCSGAELIDGNSTKTFNPTESAFIVCTGTAYVTVGYGVSSQFAFTALTKSVTGGAVTLTNNEAANNIQEYVGSLSSNSVVTFPAVVNLYVISNQTTDNGFSLTVTTGLGFSATIPPGQQATLICDGTNFLNANTTTAGATVVSLVDGTVGTPALNFAAETGTGLYRPTAGELGISVLGTKRVGVTATGVSVTGSGTFSTGIAGGTFT
tara:strand:+ start:571 stop:1806 length:1236 start_codon:yes stop_codon:yes gene_type:complete